ncbi:hypothetical protein KJ819_00400 [Patescibacteria group bacterium]|nr:hypothetical protein [Patescibacteria group bacterium]MBU1501096.1 hypothetical protein [Patescibacteria group bacterium]MBU2081031.1 hypothetical protein [Patescibacteria group bacterium]MBU2124122.1 hypothetical protein [Patescibacteria group bacterium]MBU2194978.1 hypothetical protein [Patescibacteria group bacterium]
MAVEFNEPTYTASQTVGAARKPSLFVRIILKTGLAKDVAQAEKVLLILICAAFLAALGIFFVSSSGTSGVVPLPEPIL